MATKETREPTLAEIMEEIKKSKRETRETIEKIELLRISMLLTPLAVGVSIVLFGLSILARLETSTLGIWISAIPITIVGLILVIFVGRIEERAKQQFKHNYKKKPTIF